MAIRYHLSMTTDNPSHVAINGDVIPSATRRLSGEPGSTDGLIEISLVGHDHRYVCRIDGSGPVPRLVELRMVSDGDAAEIDPASVRQIPVRRLANAAARFIRVHEEPFSTEIFGGYTDELRPDYEPGRRVLDDVHYRKVADLLNTGRECGLSPRHFAAERLNASLPTVDRWIKESKRRGFLPRDWNKNPETAAQRERRHRLELWIGTHGPNVKPPADYFTTQGEN